MKLKIKKCIARIKPKMHFFSQDKNAFVLHQ